MTTQMIANVLLNRICTDRPDLLKNYGAEAVTEAVDSVSAFASRHCIPAAEYNYLWEMLEGRLAIKF